MEFHENTNGVEREGDVKGRYRGKGRGRGRGRGGRGRVQRPRAEENVDEALDNPEQQAGAESNGSQEAGQDAFAQVEEEVKDRLREILKDGPLYQAQLAPTWRKTFGNDFPLSYQDWGFQKLGDMLNSLSDVVVRYRQEGHRDYLVNLAGQEQEVETNETNEQPLQDALAKIISGDGGDVQAAERFLQQERFQFIIDSLTREFEASLQGETESAPAPAPRQPARRGRGGRGRGRGRGRRPRNAES